MRVVARAGRTRAGAWTRPTHLDAPTYRSAHGQASLAIGSRNSSRHARAACQGPPRALLNRRTSTLEAYRRPSRRMLPAHAKNVSTDPDGGVAYDRMNYHSLCRPAPLSGWWTPCSPRRSPRAPATGMCRSLPSDVYRRSNGPGGRGSARSNATSTVVSLKGRGTCDQ